MDVTVPVPDDRIGEFYEMYGRWLSARQAAATADPDSDLVRARWLWGKFPERAKQVFAYLMDRPGDKVPAVVLAEALGIPNGINGVAGVFAWPARQCKEAGSAQPWRWVAGVDGSGASYWVEQDVADLFRQVR